MKDNLKQNNKFIVEHYHDSRASQYSCRAVHTNGKVLLNLLHWLESRSFYTSYSTLLLEVIVDRLQQWTLDNKAVTSARIISDTNASTK